MTLLALALADDLASRALSMFDALVSQGRLHYAATTPETHRVNNFTVTSPPTRNHARAPSPRPKLTRAPV